MLRNKFINELKLKSVNQTDDCVNEWRLYHYILIPKQSKCICGVNIDKNFIIKNNLNDNELIVGSICVNKFMNNNNELVESIKKIIKYDLYIRYHDDMLLETGIFKDNKFKDTFINCPSYVHIISKSKFKIKNANLKKFKKYCDYYKYLLGN
jgi:hypothetical protein